METAENPAHPSPVWLRLPTYRPRATQIMLGLLVVIFIYEAAAVGSFDPANNPFLLDRLGAKDNDAIRAGEYWRLITAMFLHANFMHIAFNGYALHAFGQQIERFYGTGRFLAIYFLAGLAGSIASFWFNPYPAVGASGAIFGLLGAMGAFFWTHRRLLGAVARAQIWNALLMVALNIGLGLTVSQAIDNLAHAGGLLGGLLAGLALAPRYRPGQSIAPDERLLEDRMPTWSVIALSLLMLAGMVAVFTVALASGGG